MRRSRNAVTAGVSPKSVGQSSSGRFEVMIVEARSYRRITISSKSSAALAGSFRIPRSSIISSGTSLRAVMTSLRSPEASARTRSDERSVLPRHTSPCTRGARQGLDRLRPRCGLCPIRLRRSRHARERCCGSAAPIASLSCLPARSPRPGGRWALHRGGVRFRQRARHQKTRLVTETPDRFVSVAVSRATRRMLQRKRSRPRIDSRSDALNSFMAALSHRHPKRTRDQAGGANPLRTAPSARF